MELELALSQLQDEMVFTYEQEGSQYLVSIDEDLTLWIKGQVAGIRLWCDLIELPDDNRLEVLKLVMRANLFGQGAGNGIISLDKVSQNLTYSIDYPWEINYEIFTGLIEQVCNYKEYWEKATRLEE